MPLYYARTAANAFFTLFMLLLLSGCLAGQQRHNTSSAVDFLYPETKEPVNIEPSVPVLSLPLRVGIAFVPNSKIDRNEVLPEETKTVLLNRVAQHFKSSPYIKSIEVIPSAYLRARGGFDNLDQIRTMYGIDVIALVGYDQVQFTDEGLASLTYWTIVGAYVIPGDKNSTHTMLDTVVYDIPSRKMLFRAPGTSEIKDTSTLINRSEQLRLDAIEGLEAANKQMIANLEQQLLAFKTRIKEQPADYKVVQRPEYTGGGAGSLDALFVLAMGAGAFGVRWLKRRTDKR